MSKMAILKIEGQGNVDIYDVWFFLKSLDALYRRLTVFYELENDKSSFITKQYGGPSIIDDMSLFAAVDEVEPLIIKSVEIHSPGFWEFLGNLNILETIRQMINDVHERKKDRDYRNAEEEKKLKLENTDRAIENLGKAIDVAERYEKLLRDRGVSSDEAKKAVDTHITNYLEGISKAKENKIIGKAKVTPQNKGKQGSK